MAAIVVKIGMHPVPAPEIAKDAPITISDESGKPVFVGKVDKLTSDDDKGAAKK